MMLLLTGLLLFLLTHSIRIIAPAWREGLRVRVGDNAWRAGYSVASLLGMVLIVLGFGMARADPVPLWNSPSWAPVATALLMLAAFILNAASGVPGNRIRTAVRHPMLAGVACWGIAHLISNGRLDDLLLFGAFLLWAIVDFRSCLSRDAISGRPAPDGGRIAGWRADLLCVLGGAAVWGVFVLFLHRWLFGVSPLF